MPVDPKDTVLDSREIGKSKCEESSTTPQGILGTGNADFDVLEADLLLLRANLPSLILRKTIIVRDGEQRHHARRKD